MQIFINNKFLPANSPVIYANDRGFLLSDGIFETLRAENNYIYFFEQHFKRLQGSAKKLHLPFSYQLSELLTICEQLLSINELDNQIAALRITLTRGCGTRGIAISNNTQETLMISAVPYIPPAKDQSITAMITTIKRNEHSFLTKLKTIQYLESILARQQAVEKGFGEGIMLNTQGAITESSVANLFFITDDKIITPPIIDGVLPGVLRNIIIDICHQEKIPCYEKTIYPDEILTFHSAFQTNSLVEIQAISKIDIQEFSSDQSNKILQKIIAAFEKIKTCA